MSMQTGLTLHAACNMTQQYSQEFMKKTNEFTVSMKIDRYGLTLIPVLKFSRILDPFLIGHREENDEIASLKLIYFEISRNTFLG